jgi:pilus assembly protein CpaE
MPTALTALMIAPDRALAQQFQASLARTRSFQILADLKDYPRLAALDVRLRQLEPDVVLVDLATDLDVACEIIAVVASRDHAAQVIGLHSANHSEALLRSLRMGAADFLYSPFDPTAQQQAVLRLQRLCRPEDAGPQPGVIVMFSSTKPGSGASTLATQTALALKRLTMKRVLLADFDLTGGTIAFYLKLRQDHSLLDVLRHSDRLEPLGWNALVQQSQGLAVLPAPGVPRGDMVEPSRLQDVLEYARVLYDWIVVDLPGIFHGNSLLAVSHADRAFLVSTAELPSLHLTRKAVGLLRQLGFDEQRFQVVVNRVDAGESMPEQDMSKIFNCCARTALPNDYFSLHRAITLGQALASECNLGRAIEEFARNLASSRQSRGELAGLWQNARPARTPAQTEAIDAVSQ